MHSCHEPDDTVKFWITVAKCRTWFEDEKNVRLTVLRHVFHLMMYLGCLGAENWFFLSEEALLLEHRLHMNNHSSAAATYFHQ